jgi:excisionase family DNA binding protein
MRGMTNTMSDADKVKRLTTAPLIPDPEIKPLLRPSEVAPLLRWSKNTIYALIASGELEAIKVKGRFWIPTSALRAYLRLPAA